MRAGSPSPSPLSALRVALVHDWLLGIRGGERLLEALIRVFPQADIHTLFYDPRGVSSAINLQPIFPSQLSGLPGAHRYYRALLPILPREIERLTLRDYDLVISSSHCVAHGVRVPEGARHVTYCHSPMRYLYDQRAAYAEGGAGFGVRALGLLAPRLAAWDRAAALRCGDYIVNSRFVAERVRRIYGLEAEVIHPPVRTDFFTPPNQGADALRDKSASPYLVVSALAPYKRIDLAIRAANTLKKELWIVGKGTEERRLRKLAGPNVRFLGWVDDTALRDLYRSARALLFPGVEDFGIAPLEAMACGCPVLALREGGLLETHVAAVTGEFFDSPTAESLAAAWDTFDPSRYDPAALRLQAERFSEERFISEFRAAMQKRPSDCRPQE